MVKSNLHLRLHDGSPNQTTVTMRLAKVESKLPVCGLGRVCVWNISETTWNGISVTLFLWAVSKQNSKFIIVKVEQCDKRNRQIKRCKYYNTDCKAYYNLSKSLHSEGALNSVAIFECSLLNFDAKFAISQYWQFLFGPSSMSYDLLHSWYLLKAAWSSISVFMYPPSCSREEKLYACRNESFGATEV